MVRYYIIAGIKVKVSCPKEWSPINDGVLSNFLTSEEGVVTQYLEFDIVEQLDKPDGEMIYLDYAKRIYRKDNNQIRYIGAVEISLDGAYARIFRQENKSYVQIKRNEIHEYITSRLILDVMEAEHLVVCNHGFLLHASYINWNGNGILFTAPSGTGKSTQAELWEKFRGAEVINGDRAAVMCEENGIYVHGIPFAGSSGIYKNKVTPLKAIVYLSQAPATKISRLSGIKAFRHIWEGCCVNNWNREDLSLCMQSVMNVIDEIPIFYLACTPDENAVTILEQVLESRGDENAKKEN